VKFICLSEGLKECDSYSLQPSVTFPISKALTTFAVNCSTQQSQSTETLAGLRLYKGTDLLLLPFCNSPPPLQLEKPERQHRDKSSFSRVIYLPQRLQTILDPEWRHCGLLEPSAELLTSKISNTLERPPSSRGPKGRKNSIAVKTFNQTSGDMGSIPSSFINHSNFIFQLTICKYT